MADYALFIGWGRVIPGREELALKLFAEATQYYQRLQQQGTIESFEPIFLEAHAGDLNGCFILKGDAQKLNQLRTDDEFVKLTFRADTLIENVGVVGAAIGSRIMKLMGVFEEITRSLEPAGVR